MKICFFSDVHGNIYALDSFIKETGNQNIDLFVFGGDFFGYYYYANECITSIRNMTDCHCILGNHDKYFLDILSGNISENSLIPKYGNSYRNIVSKISNDNIEFIKNIPLSFEINIDGKKYLFFHCSPVGSKTDRVYPDTDLNLINVKNCDVCFLGHTHHKMLRYKNNTEIINPGSIGQQRDGKGVSYVIYDTFFGKCDFRIFKYDIDSLLRDIDLYDDNENNNKLKEVLLRKR